MAIYPLASRLAGRFGIGPWSMVCFASIWKLFDIDLVRTHGFEADNSKDLSAPDWLVQVSSISTTSMIGW